LLKKESSSLTFAGSDLVSDAQNSTERLDAATIGQLATLFALCLPAVGFISRYVALLTIPRVDVAGQATIATGESIPSLAALGLEWMAAPLLATIIAMLLLGRPFTLSYNTSPLTRTVFFSKHAIVTVINYAIMGAMLVIGFFVATPILWPAAIVGLSASVLFRYLSKHDYLSFQYLWVVVVVVSMIGAIMGGLLDTQFPTGKVTFLGSTSLVAGEFVVLGSTATQTYLLPCDQSKPLISVNNQQVSTIQYRPFSHSGAFRSFYHVLTTGGASLLGAKNNCPQPRH
jgi:hypothetical protein